MNYVSSYDSKDNTKSGGNVMLELICILIFPIAVLGELLKLTK